MKGFVDGEWDRGRLGCARTGEAIELGRVPSASMITWLSMDGSRDQRVTLDKAGGFGMQQFALCRTCFFYKASIDVDGFATVGRLPRAACGRAPICHEQRGRVYCHAASAMQRQWTGRVLLP